MKSAMAAFLPVSLIQGQEQDEPLGTLAAPRMAGPGLQRTTNWDNDPYLIDLEGQLRCMCGCNQSVYQCRTTDFTCPLWPVTHARIIELVEGGMEAQEVVDLFIAESGEEVLMAPTTAGFNLAAYLLPGFLVTAAGSALVWSLARKQKVAALAVVESTPSQTTPLSSDDEDAIRREMAKLDL
jgi:cytochrome c-type biogenesis protein CcmH